MNIHKLYGIEGAARAQGVTVIIDIFRAGTTVAYLFDKGVEKILPVGTKEEAFYHKEEHPNWLLIGEERGIKIEGFEFGNSPHEISQLSSGLEGKTVILRSSHGTQGIINANNASEILFGSFATCNAIVKYAMKKNESISVVAMDGEGSEDELFADYLTAKMEHKTPKKIDEIIDFLKHHPGGWRFLDPNNKEFAEQDFYLCLSLDTFEFVPVVVDGFIRKVTN